ncbi:MAG: hypothetical protein ACTSRZ_19575 [Promethearchaeota archaeon]
MKNKKIDEENLINLINENFLGFEYTLTEFLDHLAILSWINYMAHRCDINQTNINFDGREYIRLPSGKKVIIKIIIEEFIDEKM